MAALSGNRIIIADPFHFSNIIYNLLDNSIKYLREAGVDTNIPGTKAKGLLLRIKDNGIGIAQRDLKHIFEKFYRVHEEKKKPVPGFEAWGFFMFTKFTTTWLDLTGRDCAWFWYQHDHTHPINEQKTRIKQTDEQE